MCITQDTRIQKAAVEWEPKCWNRFQSNGWTVSDNWNELQDISLSDIAKWSVQYEKKNPDYTELYYNCRKFMLELSNYLNIQWDEIILMEKIWYSVPAADKDHPYACFSNY